MNEQSRVIDAHKPKITFPKFARRIAPIVLLSLAACGTTAPHQQDSLPPVQPPGMELYPTTPAEPTPAPSGDGQLYDCFYVKTEEPEKGKSVVDGTVTDSQACEAASPGWVYAGKNPRKVSN